MRRLERVQPRAYLEFFHEHRERFGFNVLGYCLNRQCG